MKRTLSAFTLAVALVGILAASTGASLAQPNSRYNAGAYDRAVNGSTASTPGQP